jgi:hypothetical protein
MIGWRGGAGTLAEEQVLSDPIEQIIGGEAGALGIAVASSSVSAGWSVANEV